MKKYFLTYLLLALAFLSAQADLLDDLLDRSTFRPRTFTEAQMDSILNPGEQTTPRFTLEYEDEQIVWRHSRMATCFIRDNQKKTRWQMCPEKVRDCVMSPNGKYIVYGKADGNLYIYKLDFRTEVAITRDNYDEDDLLRLPSALIPEGCWPADRLSPSKGEPEKVLYNGVTDWLYEEEFGITTTACWSDDSQLLAFVRLNDTEVPIREWGPYPRAGEPNPVPQVCVYDVFYKRVLTLPLEADYIPRISWKDGRLSIKTFNRDQNTLRIFSANPKSGVYTQEKILHNETGWVEVDSDGSTPYAAAPANRRYSHDGKRYIEWTESVKHPVVYRLHQKNGKLIRVLEDNADVLAKWNALQLPEKEFFSFVTERGDTLHGWMLVPNNQGAVRNDAGEIIGQDRMLRRYPVVMTQYSGPGSRRVQDTWSKRFEYYLASIGYLVVCVDPRGTDGRGRKWLEQTYMDLGKKEAEDQISTAHYIASLPIADPGRISMIGWSYGGFQVIRTLEEQGVRQRERNEAALIRRGVAIAPVTDWRLYDSAYTERYMRRPQVNESGYDRADLRTYAEDLTGDLLIMHGLADDNVHPENTIQFIESLIEAGKYFQLMMYPGDNHFLRNGRHYRDVHERLIRFISE